MITNLRIQGFKSWRDTGTMRVAPLTGLFGPNSSGKTAILQLLLMLKQTAESADRSRVLHTGDEKTPVELGSFRDIMYGHTVPGEISFDLGWTLPAPLNIPDPSSGPQKTLFSISSLQFGAIIRGTAEDMAVKQFKYSFNAPSLTYAFGMRRKEMQEEGKAEYELIAEQYAAKRTRGRGWPLPAPVKSYGFPDQVNAYYQNVGFLSEFVLAFEQLFQNVFYLGPLREYPHRIYAWPGDKPQDVGLRGEKVVSALLAARSQGKVIKKGRSRLTVDERVAEWLKDLGLIYSFTVQPIAKNRNAYEVRVQRSASASEVLITDVGFGVSQILPVLSLCYYAPEGSIIILEQPEIHLHPAVQAGLADVFIDAIKTRNVQILLESHSEHLLRRLQRRVAEEAITPDQTALYFVSTDDGESRLNPLALDLFGNIANWPANFFGDEMGELVAMTNAAMKRRAEVRVES